MDISNIYIRNLYKLLFIFLVILSLFFTVKVLAEFRSYGMMGSGGANTITLTGYGEVMAVPDTASIHFTIQREAKTVKAAQDLVATTEKDALAFLKKSGVAEKDVKTSNASVYPKYEYQTSAGSVPCNEFGCPPRGTSVITGYEASESITVKVRNADDAGEIMQGLGALGISNLNGPNFSIDDEDDLKAEARRRAIEDARKKGQALARDLGVRLGRIASFTESGDNYPIMYGKLEMMDSVRSSPSAPAELPKGENTISSNVTITYEIR
jgi:uncharacterized protein